MRLTQKVEVDLYALNLTSTRFIKLIFEKPFLINWKICGPLQQNYSKNHCKKYYELFWLSIVYSRIFSISLKFDLIAPCGGPQGFSTLGNPGLIHYIFEKYLKLHAYCSTQFLKILKFEKYKLQTKIFKSI